MKQQELFKTERSQGHCDLSAREPPTLSLDKGRSRPGAENLEVFKIIKRFQFNFPPRAFLDFIQEKEKPLFTAVHKELPHTSQMVRNGHAGKGGMVKCEIENFLRMNTFFQELLDELLKKSGLSNPPATNEDFDLLTR